MIELSGYSGKPLWQKLGLVPGAALAIVNSTSDLVPRYWENAPFGIELTDPARARIVHLFVASRAELVRECHRIVPVLAKTATLWISWPKKASGRGSDVTEDVLREILLPTGLVDVKVCSVTDELWSGLKFVWRKELR
jgi:hypothetical protein